MGAGCFLMPVAANENEVRVWGAMRPLPVADEGSRASGSGLYFQGGTDRRRKYRAPQQDTGTRPPQRGIPYFNAVGLEPI